MDIVSPADSVFGRQESDERIEETTTVDHVTQGVPPAPGPGGINAAPLQTTTCEVQERLMMCGSPQNTVKINAFQKSLSDLAHTFSSILISEDEKNVLKSAE